MFPFYAVTFSLAVSGLQSASHSLALVAGGHYDPEQAWGEALRALDDVQAACNGTPLELWLQRSLKIERVLAWIKVKNYPAAGVSLRELDADLRLEVVKYEALLIPPDRRRGYVEPLHRFGAAVDKFKGAHDSMSAASRCYALNEWDASVFHLMRVLEQGLRWLAGNFPLTLKKPVELENWENIIGNIQARIDDELRKSVPRTPQRDDDLAFYGRAAAEFRYFKDAWRNHVIRMMKKRPAVCRHTSPASCRFWPSALSPL